jgi:MFS transporter, DHA2 family, multidrug resistance protein
MTASRRDHLGRVQARYMIVFGLLVGAVGLWMMTGYSLDLDFRTAVIARVVTCIGLAFLFAPINTAAYAFLPPGKNNAASGLMNLARNIGGSVGIAFSMTMLARRQQLHQSVLVGRVGGSLRFDCPRRTRRDTKERQEVRVWSSEFSARAESSSRRSNH